MSALVKAARLANLVNGTHYYAIGTSAALRTIVDPTANTKGVLVTYCSIFTDGGTDDTRLMTKASAPSAWNDAAAVTLLQTYKAAASRRDISRNDAFLIPAGTGLYAQSEGATNNTGPFVAYTILT